LYDFELIELYVILISSCNPLKPKIDLFLFDFCIYEALTHETGHDTDFCIHEALALIFCRNLKK